MKVKELIKKLQSYPEDADVLYWDDICDVGWDPLEEKDIFYNDETNKVCIG